ncbi:hypothetical protein Pgy4_25003, partial [Pseudomonas savastanoi pv. glycinea str. race 4]
MGGKGFKRFLGLFALAVGAPPELAVDGGIGQLLQQFAAFLIVGLEEGAELALGKHHGTGELLEVEPQTVLDQLLEFTLALVAEHLFAVQVGQDLATGLQLFGRVVACAVGFPAGAITALIDADKVHFCVTAARATP